MLCSLIWATNMFGCKPRAQRWDVAACMHSVLIANGFDSSPPALRGDKCTRTHRQKLIANVDPTSSSGAAAT